MPKSPSSRTPDPDAARTPDDAPAGLSMGLAELEKRLDGFVREYLKNKSKETVGTYRRALNEFERWFVMQKGQFRFTPDGVERFKKYLVETRGLHQVSISTYLTSLRRFCQYLVDMGMLAENPARTVKGNRRPTTHSRSILTQQEVDTLVQNLPSTTLLDLRDRAVIYLMLFAGLSEIEITRADYGDLEQTLLGWFLRVQAKGHTVKDQQVRLDAPVVEKLTRYLSARGPLKPDAPLVASHGNRSEGKRLNTRTVRNRVNGQLAEAGITRTGVTPHSLTHTAALLWLNEGLDVEEVRRRMRHGTLDTTMIYFKKQGLLNRTPEEVTEIERGT